MTEGTEQSDDASGATLLTELRARLPAFPPAQAAIAHALLADPAGAAQLSITELAQRAGTSPATVTRFCAALRLPSFSAMRLRVAAAAEVEASDGRGRQVTGDILQSDSLGDVAAKIASAEARALEDTAGRLSISALHDVVDRLASARHVEIFGVGASGSVADYLQKKLRTLGVAATAYCDARAALMSVAQADTGYAVIGISHSGDKREGCSVLAEAASRGAATIALTANPDSPITKVADQVLLTVGSDSSFRTGSLQSRIVDLLIADCICVGLALHRPQQTITSLRRTQEVLEEYID